jgi:hypothetical protein
MKRSLLGVGVVLIAACSGSSDNSTEPTAVEEGTESSATVELNDDPVTIVSEDGMLTLEIPSGAMPAGTEVTAGVVVGFEHPEFPPELVMGDVYSLEPSGLVFEVPVTIERVLATDPGNAAVTTFIVNSDTIEVAREQALEENDGGELVHRFSTIHFSDVVSLKAESIVASVTPTEMELGPNDSEDASAAWALQFEEVSQSIRDAEVELSRITRVVWKHDQSALLVDVPRNVDDDETGGSTATISCLKNGTWKVEPTVASARPLSGPGIDLWDVNPKPDGFSSEWLYSFAVGEQAYDAPFANVLAYVATGGLYAIAPPITVTCTDIPDSRLAGHDPEETGGAGGTDDEATGAGGANERLEPPEEINPPVEIEVTQEGPCGWPPPLRPDGALLMSNFKRPGDTAYQRSEGYAFVLGTPHNAFVQFEDDGTLVAKIEPRGEPPWPEWDVIEVTYTDTTITVIVDETRWDENGPCAQRVAYVYTIGNMRDIFDYMQGIPTNGIPEVDFDGVRASYEGGTFSIGGKLTFEEGVVVDLWLECSGVNLIEYRLIPIEVAVDGTFQIDEDFSDCVVINLVVAANGNQVTRSSVSN